MKQRITFKSLLVVIYLLLSSNLQAQEVPPITINVATAGTLPSLIASTKKYQITNLTVTGNLNGTDLLYIREMAGSDVNGNSTLGKLSVLDLSGANIVAGGSSYFSNYATSLNTIGLYAFRDCSGLTTVAIPNSVTSIGSCAFSSCTGLTSITIPNSVTSIGSRAFSGCTGLTSVNISNSVTTIGDFAFSSCTRLASITIPNSVTSIGDYAFRDCTGLKLVSISNSLDLIGNYAFFGCNRLVSITIPNSVTSIGDYAFRDCSGLTTVAIPNSVTSIGSCAFSSCTGLTSITIPNSVTTIKNDAFNGCTGLTSVTIGNGVTSIGNSAFSVCTGLKEIIVSTENPNYMDIEGVLFNKNRSKLIKYPNAKLATSYNIPNSVTSIDNYAFSGCTGLISVNIPNSVTNIGDVAFGDCKGITEIHCRILTPLIITNLTFTGMNKTTSKLYVPKGTYNAYWLAVGWGDFTNIIEEESTSTAISQIEASNMKVYVDQDAIIVTGADLGDNISVYTESGALLQSIKATDDIVRINVPTNHIYIVKATNKTFKVAL